MIEDSPKVSEFASRLKANGYEVELATNLAYANTIISQYGGDFLALLLDLSLDGSELPAEYHSLVADDGLLAGWVFYEKVLPSICPELVKRTLFFTGFSDRLRETISAERYKQVKEIVIEKHDTQYEKRVFKLLNELDKGRSDDNAK
jgi:hypothetical protein